MYSVYKIPAYQWVKTYSAAYFQRVFGKSFPLERERLSYALVVAKGDKIVGYTTVREEEDSCHHWSFGGVLPELKITLYPWHLMQMCLRYEKEAEGVKAITLETKNTNIGMLNLALGFRFVVTGVSGFKGETYVKLAKEL